MLAIVRLALRRVMQREPSNREVERGLKLLVELRDGQRFTPAEALRYLCLMALNLNEFVYLN